MGFKNLVRKVSKIIDQVQNIFSKYSDLKLDGSIDKDLVRLNEYSSTIDNGAFLIVVVGAVKSGKSTFMNLLCNQQVCKTDSKSCTIYPNFITFGTNTYKTFKSSSFSKNDDELFLEKIISNIIKNDNYTGDDLTIFQDDLKPYAVNDSVDKSKNYLMTSMSVRNSPIIKEGVICVDMPGIDDSKADFDRYRSIIARADYVIYLQSSNSDFVEKDYRVLDFIYETNKSVRFSYILNRRDDQDYKANGTQITIEQAKKKLDLNLKNDHISRFFDKDDHRFDSFSLQFNFEKVNSYINEKATLAGDNLSSCESEYNVYYSFVKDFVNTVLSEKDSIREKVSTSRIVSRIHTLLPRVKDFASSMQAIINEYNNLEEAFVNTSKSLNDSVKVNNFSIVAIDSRTFNDLFDKASGQIDKFAKSVNKKGLPYEKAVAKIQDFLNKIIGYLKTGVQENYSETLKKLRQSFVDKFRSVLLKDFKTKFSDNSLDIDQQIKSLKDKDFVESEFIEKKFFLKRWFGFGNYSSDEMEGVLKVVVNYVIGSVGDKSQFFETIDDIFKDAQEEFVTANIKSNIDSCIEILEKEKTRKQNHLFSDYEDYNSLYDRVNALADDLNEVVK